MKKLGLLGGMSWESTQNYYKGINEGVRERLGGLNSADCIINSVNFAVIEDMQRNGEWEKAGHYLAESAQNLEAAGAEGIIICTNTMHLTADYIKAAITIPFLHIGDITAKAVLENEHRNILLLGTQYTMEQKFLMERFRHYGLQVSVPEKGDREEINRVIFEELCLGKVKASSKEQLIQIIRKQDSIEGVILGCTELGMLLNKDDLQYKIYDTTDIHIQAAVKFMLND